MHVCDRERHKSVKFWPSGPILPKVDYFHQPLFPNRDPGGPSDPAHSEEGNRESREPAAPQLPPDRLYVALVIGSLVSIFVTMAILIIWDIRSNEDTTGEPDVTELNAENMQQPLVGLQSEPFRPDDAPMRITPRWGSSLPQSAVIRGLPGMPDWAPLTRGPALVRFDTEWDARERGIEAQLSAAAQSSRSAPESKKKRLKGLTMYLELGRDYLRNVRRHSKTALSQKRNTHQGSCSFFAAIGHALGL